MSLKSVVLILSLICLPSLALAKEDAGQELSPKAFFCEKSDPACIDLRSIPKPETSFEPVTFERVIDGDTFVASNRKIRLWGIDAPEKEHPGYLAAGWLLQGLLKDGSLTCKFVSIDPYKREVMHCMINGLDVGGMMVKLGMAKDYPKYSGGYYHAEQKVAQKALRGIWKSRTD